MKKANFKQHAKSIFFLFIMLFVVSGIYALENSSKAYSFDGDWDYVDLGTPESLRFGTGNFTVSAWVKPAAAWGRDGSSNAYNVVGHNLASGGASYTGWKLEFGKWGRGWNFCVYNGTHYAAQQGQDNNTTDWMHIAGVRDGDKIYLYINGELIAQSDIPADLNVNAPNPNYDCAVIGALKTSWGVIEYNFFDGKIDEVAIYNTALNHTELNVIMQSGPDISDANLVSYYSFDNGTAIDEKGDNDATVVGDTALTVGKLCASKGMRFDGDWDYVDLGTPESLRFGTGNFTVSAWVKPAAAWGRDGSSNAYNVVGHNLASGGASYTGWKLEFGKWGRGWNFCVYNGTHYAAQQGQDNNTTDWMHIAGVRDGDKIYLYINGELIAQSDIPADLNVNAPNPNYDCAVIGALKTSWGVIEYNFFDGMIDEVAIYRKALAPRELKQVMDIGPNLRDGDLVSFYSFDDGTASDEKGGNHGSLQGNCIIDTGNCYTGFEKVAEIEAIAPALVKILPDTGNVTLTASDSLTAADLVNVDIDDTELSIDAHDPYDTRMSDGLPAGEGPYVAAGIKTFRFRHFTNEFNYGGWHNFEMIEYASTHGFNYVNTYNSTAADWDHLPAGTKFMVWSGFNYNPWMDSKGYGADRWDRIPSLQDQTDDLLAENRWPHDPGHDTLMLDLEVPSIPLDPEKLRQQSWYPGSPTNINEQFEADYYGGFVNAEVATMETARVQGWTHVGIYGWQPRACTWWNIGDNEYDSLCQERWDRYGKAIAQGTDLIYTSVYNFYHNTNKNVAYVLSNIDANLEKINQLRSGSRKPVRPYFWNLYQGDGLPQWQWWTETPLKLADMRAQIAMSFFAGTQGLVLWSWSGTDNHHVVNVEAGKSYYVRQTCTAAVECNPDGSANGDFTVNTPIFITSVNGDTVRFQRTGGYSCPWDLDVIWHYDSEAKINVLDNPDDGNYQKPVYTMNKTDLEAMLRRSSAPVAVVVEGMSLAKVCEYALYYGEPCIDVSAKTQFSNELPIVRRVRFGKYHIIATYDPQFEERGEQEITLNDFAGKTGLNVTVKTDGKTRIYIVSE